MLTAEAVKAFARDNLPIDKLGVANIERFRDAPPDMSPTTIMPRAKSVIVFIMRIPRGCYRGIDEGTHWPSYTVFGYTGLARMLMAAGYKLARFIEGHGHEAAVVSAQATTRELGPVGSRPAPDKPRREVTMHHRIAAVVAGLGEIGWSKVLLTEEFGPRQRIGIVLTEAELKPDPIQVGRICDRCKRCVKECPGGAIPEDRSVSVEIEGHELEWADIDLGKCKLTHFGLNRAASPHLVKRYPGLYLPIPDQEVTWREAWDLGWAVFPSVPTFDALTRHGVIAMCGARGCIVACMKHLESVGKVKNVFHRKVFSTEEPWRLPDRPPKAQHRGFIYDAQEDRSPEGVLPAAATEPPTWQ